MFAATAQGSTYEAAHVIGDLIKQLVKTLDVFMRYHLSRRFGVLRSTAAEPSVRTYKTSAPEGLPRLPLDAAYTKTVSWQTDRTDVAALDLKSNLVYQLWQETPKSPKWTQYFENYQEVFGPRRTLPMRILEIGVFRGASLRLWKRYFDHAQTSLIGIDIDPQCAVYDAPSQGVHVRIGSQTDREFLGKVVADFGPFDLIIDDGSHHSSHMIASFNHLYASGLKEGGIYFAEDLHANYWLPMRDSANSFLDFCKDLLELMHAHYWNNPLSAWTTEMQFGTRLRVEVPEITTMIKQIRFFDSMVAIYKTRLPHPPRFVEA